MSLVDRLQRITERMEHAARKSGRSVQDITLIAVSKSVPVESLREAYAFGVRHFAENYAQEAVMKLQELQHLAIDWHFIGQLQSNKIKQIAGRFSLIHSVDRVKIAAELSARATDTQNILIEVNMAEEKSKAGCAISELKNLIVNVQELKNIKLQGLMFMPPSDLTEPEQHRYYAKARELRDEMQAHISAPHSLVELSMGTSHDFTAAICEGATLVRVGTALFGARKKRA